MFDRILNGAMWLTIVGMIMLIGGGALVLGYRGLLDTCCGRYPLGVTGIGSAGILGAAAFLLCRHANDLLDR